MRMLIILTVALVICACGDQSPDEPAALTLPEGFFISAAPSGALAIAALKGTVTAGDEVVVHGRIGGRNPAFVPGRAAFVIYDDQQLELTTDDCPSGCNLCSVAPADLLRATATIQVVDDAGRVLSGNLSRQGGLLPGARVTVRGTVLEGGDTGVLVINAGQIFVQDPQTPTPVAVVDTEAATGFSHSGCGDCGGH